MIDDGQMILLIEVSESQNQRCRYCFGRAEIHIGTMAEVENVEN